MSHPHVLRNNSKSETPRDRQTHQTQLLGLRVWRCGAFLSFPGEGGTAQYMAASQCAKDIFSKLQTPAYLEARCVSGNTSCTHIPAASTVWTTTDRRSLARVGTLQQHKTMLPLTTDTSRMPSLNPHRHVSALPCCSGGGLSRRAHTTTWCPPLRRAEHSQLLRGTRIP